MTQGFFPVKSQRGKKPAVDEGKLEPVSSLQQKGRTNVRSGLVIVTPFICSHNSTKHCHILRRKCDSLFESCYTSFPYWYMLLCCWFCFFPLTNISLIWF